MPRIGSLFVTDTGGADGNAERDPRPMVSFWEMRAPNIANTLAQNPIPWELKGAVGCAEIANPGVDTELCFCEGGWFVIHYSVNVLVNALTDASVFLLVRPYINGVADIELPAYIEVAHAGDALKTFQGTFARKFGPGDTLRMNFESTIAGETRTIFENDTWLLILRVAGTEIPAV